MSREQEMMERRIQNAQHEVLEQAKRLTREYRKPVGDARQAWQALDKLALVTELLERVEAEDVKFRGGRENG